MEPSEAAVAPHVHYVTEESDQYESDEEIETGDLLDPLDREQDNQTPSGSGLSANSDTHTAPEADLLPIISSSSDISLDDSVKTFLTFLSDVTPEFYFTDDAATKVIRSFTPDRQPGPVRNQADMPTTSLGYFQLFFDDDFLQQVVEWTNTNADRKRQLDPMNNRGVWYAVSLRELKAFLGIQIIIEKCYKGAISDLWSNSFPLSVFPGIRKIFTRNRFEQVYRYLHFVDESTIEAYPERLYKIKNLLDHLKLAFQREYTPHREIAVDECLVPHKGRLVFKQYCKDKPVKWGIKLWMLADNHNGYCYNFNTYCGSYDDDIPIGLATRVVLELMYPLADKGYHLYTDRFYTSPYLLYCLLQIGTLACGTVQKNRKNFPAIFLDDDIVLDRGMYAWSLCKITGITATKWMDRRPIYFLSSIHDTDEPGLTIGRKSARGRPLRLPCPPTVVAYNKYMGGVDRNDQMTRLDRSRKAYRWYLKLERKALMLALYNAFLLDTRLNKPKDFHGFTMEVAHELVGDFTCRGRDPENTVPLDNSRLSPSTHCPKSTSTPRKCRVCLAKWNHQRKMDVEPLEPARRTVFICASPFCGVSLCITSTSTCWDDWHHKVEYWR